MNDNFEHGYAKVNGVRLHYARAGDNGRLVILLHGFPEFWYSWRAQLEFLSDDFTVVAPDLRGYNLSDKPLQTEDYRLDKLVGDVAGLVKHFGREKAVIAGHDWGAIIAWATALRRPEIVEKLVAMQVPPPGAWRANFTAKQALASWYILFFQIPRLPELLLSANNHEFLKRALKSLAAKRIFTAADFAEYQKSWSKPGALTAAINYYRANFFNLKMLRGLTAARDSRAGKISVPTLFIYGEREKAIVAETARGIERFVRAPYTELRIPDSGHWVQQEAAATVNRALNDFLSDSVNSDY